MKSLFFAKKFYFLLVIVFFSFLIASCLKTQHYKLSQFISAETCGGCHSEIYEQWKTSMHGIAHKDPIYNKVAKFYRKQLINRDEIKEGDSCVKCHTPIGFFTGFPTKLSQDLTKTPVIAQNGVQCDFCHSATGAYATYNNKMKLNPKSSDGDNGIKRGPFKDSVSSFHKTAYSEFHTKSAICGTCHNVRHVTFGTHLESTYDEWEKSPYNSKDLSKRIECQGCHMYQRPGHPATASTKREKNPGVAASGGPKREHIFTHYFVGGNSFIPTKFSKNEQSKMAEERLKHAASLEISRDKKNKNLLLVKIKNIGAGHYLPTGLTDVRQMWLEVVITNSQGKKNFITGRLDKNGYLAKDAIIFNTIFGDGKGNPIINISKAKEILRDKRIPPGKFLMEKIIFPSSLKGRFTVSVNLKYRIVSQKLVDTVLGKGKLKIPVVLMTTAVSSFK